VDGHSPDPVDPGQHQSQQEPVMVVEVAGESALVGGVLAGDQVASEDGAW